MIVDLFDPPQRAAYRQRPLDLQAEGKTLIQIAQTLVLTKTAVQNALALDRRMRSWAWTIPTVRSRPRKTRPGSGGIDIRGSASNP